eukprot:2570536-Pleurochrysis_carterae.AAC.1
MDSRNARARARTHACTHPRLHAPARTCMQERAHTSGHAFGIALTRPTHAHTPTCAHVETRARKRTSKRSRTSAPPPTFAQSKQEHEQKEMR